MANNRITKALTWQALETEYRIRNKNGVKENELADAIASGEILALLQACANELHNGDFNSVIRAFRRNLSSMKCNKVKSDSFRSIDRERYELLNSYTEQFVDTVANATVTGKPKWQYTIEDIESLAGNHEELRKLYNSMMDKISKDPTTINTVTTEQEYRARVERVRILRNEAAAAPVEKVSDSILSKLTANKKLSAEEAAELLRLLSK